MRLETEGAKFFGLVESMKKAREEKAAEEKKEDERAAEEKKAASTDSGSRSSIEVELNPNNLIVDYDRLKVNLFSFYLNTY